MAKSPEAEMLGLTRLDSTKFSELLEQWKPHFGDDEGLLFAHCKPHLEHAQRIVSERPPDARYGIFGLLRDNGDYEGFTHINHNKPGSEVRLVWNALHPKYEEQIKPTTLSEFTFSYISGAIALANGDMTARAVRIYLHNATDRQYAQGIVTALQHTVAMQTGAKGNLAMAGNWLHIGDVTGLVL